MAAQFISKMICIEGGGKQKDRSKLHGTKHYNCWLYSTNSLTWTEECSLPILFPICKS